MDNTGSTRPELSIFFQVFQWTDAASISKCFCGHKASHGHYKLSAFKPMKGLFLGNICSPNLFWAWEFWNPITLDFLIPWFEQAKAQVECGPLVWFFTHGAAEFYRTKTIPETQTDSGNPTSFSETTEGSKTFLVQAWNNQKFSNLVWQTFLISSQTWEQQQLGGGESAERFLITEQKFYYAGTENLHNVQSAPNCKTLVL